MKSSLVILFIAAISNLRAQDNLTKKEFQSILTSREWYIPNSDSAYFINDTLILEDATDSNLSTYYVWHAVGKRKIESYSLNSETVVSGPVLQGCTYRLIEENNNLYLEMRFRRKISELYQVISVLCVQEDEVKNIKLLRCKKEQ